MITLLLVFTFLSFSHAFKCSVSFCAYLGARATCCPASPCLPMACAVWHATKASTLCNFECSSKCSPPSRRPIATDAIAYCNQCTLMRASCKSGFDIVGPIDYGVSYAIDVETPPTPAILQSTPDVPEPTAEPSPEESLENFFTPSPELSQPSSCSLDFCSRYGADTKCESSNGSSTCLSWSKGTNQKECVIFCASDCLIGPAAPTASDGHTYCSLCHLRMISCRSGYTIYGPITENVGPSPIPGMQDSL